MGIYKMSFWQVFLAAGPLIWPILLCSVIATAIFFEKILYLNRSSIDIQGFLNKILEKMKRHEIKEALEICDSVKSPVANILKAGILKYDRPKEQIIQAILDASQYEVPRLEKNLSVLNVLANSAVLLGLLGTALGLLACFQAIQAKAQLYQAVLLSDLAGGIWEALLTTIAGLVVAIPAFLAYNYLAARVNNYISDMEKVSTELVNFLTE
ncbi:MAG: MotA/TolQ/ExbB proton channel family protein [Candidatus Omnitrophota bacterium]|jgi:biopolymer transport protein ExbB